MDGILLCKLVNAVCPGKIKEKEIKLSVDKSRIKVPGSKGFHNLKFFNN
jgi:hypothetical protein